MTPDEFLEEYRQSQSSDQVVVDSYPLYLMLRKPTNLDYVVSGILDKDLRKGLDSPKFFRKVRDLDGGYVSHNFRYEMWGTASGIEGRFEQDCRLIINADTSGYRRCESSGNIGGGRFSGKQFLLNMAVSPEIAKNIILRRILAPYAEQGHEAEEDDAHATWMRLTISIFNAHKRGAMPDAFFSIGDAYFSSTFSPFQFT